MKFENKSFIISGGASGLGLATAQALVKSNAHVILLDLNAPALETAQSEMGDLCKVFAVDITDAASIERVFTDLEQNNELVYGLINCAGIGPAKRTVGKNGPVEIEFFKKVIDVNLIGSYNLIRLAANLMQRNDPHFDGQKGIIINTASIAAFDGQVGQAAYAASKGGIVALTLPLAREFVHMGIRVMTIAPGIFETPLMNNLNPAAIESLSHQTVFPQRFGKPHEYASLVMEIIKNPMLNGEVIRLDGAVRMNMK